MPGNFFGGKAVLGVKDAPPVALDIVDKLLEQGIAWVKPFNYGKIIAKNRKI